MPAHKHLSLTSVEPDEQRWIGVSGEVLKQPVKQIASIGLVDRDITRPGFQVGTGGKEREVYDLVGTSSVKR